MKQIEKLPFVLERTKKDLEDRGHQVILAPGVKGTLVRAKIDSIDGKAPAITAEYAPVSKRVVLVVGLPPDQKRFDVRSTQANILKAIEDHIKDFPVEAQRLEVVEPKIEPIVIFPVVETPKKTAQDLKKTRAAEKCLAKEKLWAEEDTKFNQRMERLGENQTTLKQALAKQADLKGSDGPHAMFTVAHELDVKATPDGFNATLKNMAKEDLPRLFDFIADLARPYQTFLKTETA